MSPIPKSPSIKVLASFALLNLNLTFSSEAAEVLRADPQKFAQVVRRTMNGRSLDSAR